MIYKLKLCNSIFTQIKSINHKKTYPFLGSIKEWCIAWWHSGREDSDDYPYEQEEHSDIGYAKFLY